LLCLVASALILGGFIIRPNSAASEQLGRGTEAARSSASQGGAVRPIDTTNPWYYTFSNAQNPLLDTSLWTIENGITTATYNNELQTYTNRLENVRVEDGSLVIEARTEQRDGQAYTSARINTRDSFAFTYGTLEVDMKLPRGVGTWPAAWLMPNNERYKHADFPEVSDTKRSWALNGEIDFMETVGYLPGEIIPAAHNYNSLGGTASYTPGFVDDPYTAYHRYGVIKTRESITFTIDGVPYASRHKTSDNPLDWPYDQSYYLILNLAIGGKWAGAHGVDETMAPWKMHVRSISYKPL
jgi:beta-glucanase (GH16 family)